MTFDCPKCKRKTDINVITIGGDNFFAISCINCNIRSKSTDKQHCINKWHSYDYEQININFGCLDARKSEISGIYDDSGKEKFNVNILIHNLERFSRRLHELENLNGKIKFDLGGVKKDLHAVRMMLELRKGRNQNMAKLTTKSRNKLPKSAFAEPGKRAYPVNDRAHAKNAKARASQMVNKGKLSESEKSKIDAKANKVLGKAKSKHEKPKSRAKSSRGLSL